MLPDKLTISADELDYIASALTNESICRKLYHASLTMREAAAELRQVNEVPSWLVPLQDSIYSLCVSIIAAGWVVRTVTTPGAKLFNVNSFAIDTYEKLMSALKTNVYAVTRASRQYPTTTRRTDIRRQLKLHREKRND